MGAYHIADCHDCHTYTTLGKYTQEGAEAAFEDWRAAHVGHNVGLTTDYDEYAEAKRRGLRVVADGYYGLITEKDGEAYVEIRG